jgi:predicted RNA-binding protein YlxR (DUF448 family)
VRVHAVEEQQQAVDELEQKLQERGAWTTLGLNASWKALQHTNTAWRAMRLPLRLSRRILRMFVPLS